jgi:glycosyltransferase involved in cell wall biosynthesis
MMRPRDQSAATAERRASRRERELVDGWRAVDTQLDHALIGRTNGTRPKVEPRPRVSVVIPTLNEAANLPHVLPRLDGLADEVILVDGGSVDGTCDVARALRADIRTLKQDGCGKGNALSIGFAAATGDIIVAIDADGSTDPAEIPSFVGALLAGADFAKGSRFLEGGGTADMEFYRRLGNSSFVALVRLLFGGRYTDLCYGYNAFWRDVLPVLGLNGDGFEIETMMNIRALRARLNVVEVASCEGRRVHGTSRLRTIPDGWRVLRTIFRERFSTARDSTELAAGASAGLSGAPPGGTRHRETVEAMAFRD